MVTSPPHSSVFFRVGKEDSWKGVIHGFVVEKLAVDVCCS